MTPSDHKRRRTPAGFTLVEILIVVTILGILAAVTLPSFATVGRESAQIAFARDVRAMAETAERFRLAKGEYPEDSGSGQPPAGWDEFADPHIWIRPTAIGGVWDFERDSFGMGAGFGVHFYEPDRFGTNPGDAYMTEVDERVDDGNLSTGSFRKVAADRYYLILEAE